MRVPVRHKVRFLSGKYLVRKAMADRLPQEVLRRTKKGFPTPIRPWLRNQLFSRLSAVLDDGRMAEREIVRPKMVRRLLEEHRHGSSAATERVWRLLTFEIWCRIFLDGDIDARTVDIAMLDRVHTL
jgi:asparagine synthase (glutamine-hydrolysing)